MPKKNLYFIDHYQKCGAMPLYLIFYRNIDGRKGHYVLLCPMRKLRVLLRQHKGFSDPEKYGRIIYRGQESEPGDILKSILKTRYYFDLDVARNNSGNT